MTTTTDRSSGKVGNYRVIGTRPIRHDGLDKVTGTAKYGADIHLQGLLHGKILRSPYAHARILSIDTSKAEALPGVKAVVTSADFPIVDDAPINLGETLGNPRMLAENGMAREKVLYKGHAVAAVAATNQHVAEEALDLIEVKYEVLPPVLDVREAMKPDAPQSDNSNYLGAIWQGHGHGRCQQRCEPSPVQRRRYRTGVQGCGRGGGAGVPHEAGAPRLH